MKKKLDLSAGLSTPEGYVLRTLWYGHFLQNLLFRDEYSGYPNNGMRHTLFLNINSVEDLFAFLELVKEFINNDEKFEAFKQHVLKKLK